MSVPSHRALRSSRPRRWRAASAVLAAATLALTTAGLAMADGLSVDGDTLSVSNALAYKLSKDTPQDHLCSDRGTAVGGSIVVSYNGSKHFTPGEPLTVTHGTTPTGVTIGAISGQSAPSNWDGNEDSFTIPFTTTVASDAPDVNEQVEFTVTGDDSGVSATAGSGSFLVFIHCDAGTTPPANTEPTVAITSSATTSDEGSKTSSITFSITDPDANQTWDWATGYPICGTDGTASDKAIDNTSKTGSFKCTFPDGPATRTVKVKVTDSAGADSNEATIGATVNNVPPTVGQPAFTTTSSIDCRNSITLGSISFSDPGVNDANWTISIDWKDGNIEPDITATTQGPQSDVSHTYNTPGTYTPTVTVTDKDGGSSQANSSNSVTVNQVYTTDFLPPFDDTTPASGLIVNTMKNGRTVPVKATIYDVCAGSYVTSGAVSIAVTKTTLTQAATADPVENYSDAGASSGNTNLFRWNADATSPTGGFWIYNLDSKGLGLTTGTVYRVDIYLGTVKVTTRDWAILQPVK